MIKPLILGIISTTLRCLNCQTHFVRNSSGAENELRCQVLSLERERDEIIMSVKIWNIHQHCKLPKAINQTEL